MHNGRWRPNPRWLVGIDAALAIAVLAVELGPPVAVGGWGDGWRWWPAVPVLVGASALPVRRRWPVPALVAVVVAFAARTVSDSLSPYLVVPAACTMYTVAASQPRRRWIPTVVVGVLSAVGVLVMTASGPGPTVAPSAADRRLTTVVFVLVALGCGWTLGRLIAERRASAARWAEQRAEHAVAEERLRLAREMHDVVAHALGVIAVKAGVANHVVARRPAEAHDALRIIETTSRQALTEMRQLLGVLRGTADAGGPEALAPAPGVQALPGLVERAELVGVPVRLDLDVDRPLSDGVGLSVYRIVQEAVTNVVKHAAPANCRVRVATLGDEVHIEVDDDGPGVRSLPAAPGPDGGHGLVGMRERVGMYGGTLHTGPGPDGGFRVRATLPYRLAGSPS